MTPADKASITTVERRLFDAIRNNPAVRPTVAASNTADEFRAAPYHGRPL